LLSRTYPKAVGYEQVHDGRPWYTKTGRLEFYREEDEFIEAGENLPVHREPVDSTFYEPNVIVAPAHEALRPKGPADYGVAETDLSCDVRQGRNVVKTWAETKVSRHPRAAEGYRFIFHTPKYRHGAHTMPIDTDMIALLFGPFGDVYRHDKRAPFVTEGYVDIHPGTRGRSGWRTATMSGSTAIRRTDRSAAGARTRATTSSRACSAAPGTTRARRAA
jgi:nitrate reductase alpha subunit